MRTGGRREGRLLALFLLASNAALPVLAASGAATRPFRIAAEDYPPYEFEQDGRVAGINADVIHLAFSRMGIPYTLRVNYPFARVWMMLKSGTVDAAPSISHQISREPYLHFTDEQKAFLETGALPSDYLWLTEYVFFINRRYRESLRYDSNEQLESAGYRVAVLQEYTYDPAFRELKLDRRSFPTPRQAFEALAEGEVDLLPMDRTVGQWLLREMKLDQSITFLPRALFRKPYLLVFSKASDYPDVQGVMTRFYAEVRKMRESGEYHAIHSKYLRASPAIALPRPLIFVCEEWSPFEFLKDGEPAGINVEVVDRICSRRGWPYEIRIYPWSRAWMLVTNGRADAVISVSYKDTREAVLLYTPEQRAFATTGEVPPDFLWLSEYVFFVKRVRADTVRFESLEQLRRDGRRIGTNRDYSYSPEFLAAQLTVHEYPTTRDGLTALVNGDIDMYPMDRTVGASELDKMGLLESVTYLPTPLLRKPYLLAFSRISDMPQLDEIRRIFYEDLRRMRENGEYDEILKHYRHRPPTP